MTSLLSHRTLGRGAVLVDANDTVANFLSVVITSLEFVHCVHFAQICVVLGLLACPHLPLLGTFVDSVEVLVYEGRCGCLINIILQLLVLFLLLHLV